MENSVGNSCLLLGPCNLWQALDLELYMICSWHLQNMPHVIILILQISTQRSKDHKHPHKVTYLRQQRQMWTVHCSFILSHR